MRKHAALKFEVVCFPSNKLLRYWRETQVSKAGPNKNMCYPIQISKNRAEEVKIIGTFFYMFLTAKNHGILHVTSYGDCEGPRDLIYVKYPFLVIFISDSIF